MDHARDDDSFGAAPRSGHQSTGPIQPVPASGWFLRLSNSLRCVPWRAFGRARTMGRRNGAEPALSDRRHFELGSLAAVLDREKRDQDDGHAGLARLDVRRSNLERGRLSGGNAETAPANLYCVALARDVQQCQRPLANSSNTFHSSSLTGATDRRDWRISSILASRGSALISASVTGRANGLTGSTRTEIQLESLGQAGPRARPA